LFTFPSFHRDVYSNMYVCVPCVATVPSLKRFLPPVLLHSVYSWLS